MKTEQVKTRKLTVDKYLDNQAIFTMAVRKAVIFAKNNHPKCFVKLPQDAYYWKEAWFQQKKGTIDKKLDQKTLTVFRRNCNLFERVVAEKVKTSASTVHQIKGRANLWSFKVQNLPDRTEKKKKFLKPELENCIQFTWQNLNAVLWMMRSTVFPILTKYMVQSFT